jgi:anti-sigma factor RsiW
MKLQRDGELTCQELVELVTDYLDGRLSARERIRFEKHIAGCDGCSNYIEQFKITIGILGTLPEEAISDQARADLLKAFETWKPST